MTDAGTSLMGAIFKEYSNMCHYIAYSFGRTGLLDFSLFTGYRPDLLRGTTRENLCHFYRVIRGLILSACSFLFSACNSDPATSQLLQS